MAARLDQREDLAGKGAAELGIAEADVSRELEEEGVQKFSASFDSLLKALVEKEKAMRVA